METNQDGSQKVEPATAFDSVLSIVRKHVEDRKHSDTASSDPSEDFVHVAKSDVDFWCEQFETLFITNFDNTHDDLIFFVRSNWATESGQDESDEEPFFVVRHGSPKIPPIGDRSIQWERSFYLNLALHSFVYTLTIAIGKRPPHGPLGIITKTVRRVHPSPSKTRMDQAKGTVTELTYPFIFFPVDDFDDFFSEVVCEEGQLVCVELVAEYGERRTAVFQGSVPYGTLVQAYNNKRNTVSGWELFSSGRDTRRKEFLKMRGPKGIGQAEMAVSVISEGNDADAQGQTGVRRLINTAIRWGSASSPTDCAVRLNACLTFVNMHVEALGTLLLGTSAIKPLLDSEPNGA